MKHSPLTLLPFYRLAIPVRRFSASIDDSSNCNIQFPVNLRSMYIDISAGIIQIPTTTELR